MLTGFNRVFKLGFNDFYRNKGRSVAAIFILIVTLFLVTGLFFLQGISHDIIAQVQNKIDITAYFKSDTSEQDILNAKDQIVKQAPGIKSIQYVSKDQALADFIQKHKDNDVFASALTQVGENPFLPSLNITTTGSALQYQQVANILQSDQFANLLDKVDYSEKKATIDKVFSITSSVTTFGIVLAVILMLVAVLIVLNTIKLAIDSAKEEITTQRIVGASSWFVRMPFIIQGIIFGCVAFINCFVITFLLAYFFAPNLLTLLSGFNIFHYFLSNVWLIMAIQLGVGVGLGVISSFIVVQKYLKI